MKTIGIAAILGTALATAGISLGAGTAAANTNCGIAYGWSVTAVGPTSCAFAYNVARQVPWSAGSGSVRAYSPATGLNYFMECDRWNNSTIECSGGNSASVILQGG